MPTRAEQRRATRRRLITEARASFREEGFDATTLAAVARRAGVAVGTVCLHFPTKADLIAGAFHEEIERLLQTGRERVVDGPIEVRLSQRMAPFFAFYLSDPPLSRALLKQTLFLTGEWGDRFRDQGLAFIGEVAVQLRHAVDTGELSPALEVDLAAQGFFSDYFGTLMAVLSMPDGTATAEVGVARLRALLVQRLRAPGGES
jgi:AcrR family transcriptional regulator